jgi:hypothetical protein
VPVVFQANADNRVLEEVRWPMLEREASKGACPVLRGGGAVTSTSLPDQWQVPIESGFCSSCFWEVNSFPMKEDHMKRVLALTTATLLGIAGWARTIDLDKIDRTIAKEPVYQGKPVYCLLVFGPEAKTRVWLVLDAKAKSLYVDRNGNRDLTEKGERFTPANHNLDQRNYEVGEIIASDGRTKYSKLRIEHWGTAAEAEGIGFAVPESFSLRVEANGNLQRVQLKAFGEKPQKAPVIHVDGPLTFGLFDAPVQAFVRAGKPNTLTVLIGTWDVDRKALTTIPIDGPPSDVHPVAEIEFPGKKPEATPLKVKVILDQRC